MKSNTEQLALVRKHLGEGGARFRKFCGMKAGAYCNAFVCYGFNEADNASLFYGGKKVTYCPTSIKWCYKNLASIPIYLAMPSDVIYFDWELNGIPNHIGFVDHRISDVKVATVEGNTSKTDKKGKVIASGVVAEKVRVTPYIQAVFRPHFKPTAFNPNKKLVVDGYFGYNSIAVMQKWLGVKVDAILKKSDIVALQKRLKVNADGDWGPKTSKALQKVIGTKVDGAFGPMSVKAFQDYLNKHVFKVTASTPSTAVTKTKGNKIADCAVDFAYAGEPKDSKYPSGKPKASYKKALDKAYPSHKEWGNGAKQGASCDVFVGTCVRSSGVDKKYPRGLAEQEKYLDKHFAKIKYAGDRKVLKDGDIGVMQYNGGKSGHTFIVVIRGGKLKICEANYKDTYPITITKEGELNWRLKKRTGKDYVHIYRAK